MDLVHFVVFGHHDTVRGGEPAQAALQCFQRASLSGDMPCRQTEAVEVLTLYRLGGSLPEGCDAR
jgi:hypothetical protein